MILPGISYTVLYCLSWYRVQAISKDILQNGSRPDRPIHPQTPYFPRFKLVEGSPQITLEYRVGLVGVTVRKRDAENSRFTAEKLERNAKAPARRGGGGGGGSREGPRGQVTSGNTQVTSQVTYR